MTEFDISPAVTIPTARGPFRAQAFRSAPAGPEHLVLTRGAIDGPAPERVPVRIHSECLTGDVFGSERCDCRSQLEGALDLIARRGRGILIYLRQEGRGIGLVDKLRAYELQDGGLDTVDANLALGHAADARTYEVAVAILGHYGVVRVELITNNPEKAAALTAAGIAVEAIVPAPPAVTEHNRDYLRVKSERFRHLLPV